MSILLTLDPPISPEVIDRIRIYKSLFVDGSYSLVADLNARDGNGAFITTYEDSCGHRGYWYKVGYLSSDSTIVAGFKIYKEFSNRVNLFTFPSLATVNNGQAVYFGQEGSRDEFEAKHGTLPSTALYYSVPSFFNILCISSTIFFGSFICSKT